MSHNLHRRRCGGYLLVEEKETGLLYILSLYSNSVVDLTQLQWLPFHNHCFLDWQRRRLCLVFLWGSLPRLLSAAKSWTGVHAGECLIDMVFRRVSWHGEFGELVIHA